MSTVDGAGIDFAALIREMLARALEIEPDSGHLAANTLLLDLPNMNSLAMLRGMMLIEERLGIELEDDYLITSRTVGALASAIEGQYAARRTG